MKNMQTMDGNTAAAYISYAFTEVAAIYPITPSSPMAEVVDEWAEHGKKNIFGEPVKVVEMQSEAGAAGTVHGSLKTGALTTTYTASQGLLLMLPNMYKIAGELLPSVFHVAARAVATSALSIFGDHSDVMAARSTGFCMLAESSVQEVMDLSAVAHLASIESSLPFVNFFDGFRTSHEIQKIEVLDYEDLKPLVNQEMLAKFRSGAMNPNHPDISGTAQNADIYFQSREMVNQFYDKVPGIVKHYMDEINKLRGTNYDLVDYYGDPEATDVIVSMGSVSPAIQQTVTYLNNEGRKVGHLNIHLYRPFPTENFLEKLPKSVKRIAVLDRTKEPGADGEPLLLDIQGIMYRQANHPVVIGGRYGIASKDVTPDQIVAVYDNLAADESVRKPIFTVGINDDITNLSLPMTDVLDLTNPETYQAKFWGFGSDGTVGANKQAIKIIGNNTDMYAQAYFAYDSKKSNGLTISHVRFGKTPIRSTYLVTRPNFVGCHNATYLHKYNLVKGLRDNGVFLLNTIWDAEQIKTHLPQNLKRYLAQHNINFYIINAMEIARGLGLGRRINTVMSAAFFEVTQILPHDEFVPLLKEQIEKTYLKKSRTIVEKNWSAIDQTFDNIHKVEVPAEWAELDEVPYYKKDEEEPAFISEIMEPMLRQEGDDLSVKDLMDHGMLGGKIPMGTAAYEKRDVTLEVPVWLPEKCIQCNECSFVCPHAAIRPFLVDEDELNVAPEGYHVRDFKGADGLMYRIQVSVEDCTGCGLCAEVCPSNALEMRDYDGLSKEANEEKVNWAFSMSLKHKENPVKLESIKGSQFEKPLLEFSGACSGCGETGYVKLLTQLYGDRMMIANTTGCSSIWGASSPTSSYTTNHEGKGPAWSNSLFEDNAEYGYGMYIANNVRRDRVKHQIEEALDAKLGSEDTQALMQDWLDHYEDGNGSRQRATKLEATLQGETDETLQAILADKDMFVKPSQWIIGGDGWAYDIGFAGIDHVLASGEDVNIFVYDNELYANTGGQMSKATPTSAVAKFAAGGKKTAKKDLGMMAATYGNVYVASVSLNANLTQTLKAITEAESYPGPSIIIGYTPCIEHGLKGGMRNAIEESKQAVESGYWPLYRFDPRLAEKGKDPLRLDFKKTDFEKIPALLNMQARFTALKNVKKDQAVVDEMFDETKDAMAKRSETYSLMFKMRKSQK